MGGRFCFSEVISTVVWPQSSGVLHALNWLIKGNCLKGQQDWLDHQAPYYLAHHQPRLRGSSPYKDKSSFSFRSSFVILHTIFQYFPESKGQINERYSFEHQVHMNSQKTVIKCHQPLFMEHFISTIAVSWCEPAQLCWNRDHNWTRVFGCCSTEGDLFVKILHNCSFKKYIFSISIDLSVRLWAHTCTRSLHRCQWTRRMKSDYLRTK